MRRRKADLTEVCQNEYCNKCYEDMPGAVARPQKAQEQVRLATPAEVSGRRYNKGKPMYCGPSPWAELEVAKVYAFGAEKHKDPVTGESGRNNWQKGLSYTETMESVLRHCSAFLRGEKLDEESKLHSLAHAIFGLQVLIHFDQFAEKYKQFDDRVK